MMFRRMAKMFPFVVLCVLTMLIMFAESEMLHERMTREEVFNTFHTTSEDVPNYHVVQIMHNMNKRDADGKQGSSIKIRTTSEDINVYLYPTEGHIYSAQTPVWTLYKNLGVLFHKEDFNIVQRSITYYYSRTQSVANVISYVKRSTNERSFYGQIGDMAIWPLPKRLRKAARKFDKNPRLSNVDGLWSRTHYHILYARSESASSNITEAINREYRMAINSSLFDNTHSSQGKRSVQSIVYPSILVVTDYNDYKLRPYNTSRVSAFERRELLLNRIIYVLAFFNGIDLRFRALSDPKVRLHLAGIVIGTDRSSVPFINNYRDVYGQVDGNEVVGHNMETFWLPISDVNVRSYHGLIALTDSKLKNHEIGLGVLGRTCINSGPVSSTLVSDNMKFGGIEVATHELGHLLGVDHDGNGANSNCDSDEGYIMAPSEDPYTDVNYKWSPCSLREFTLFLRRQSVSCMDKEILSYGKKEVGLLPGKLLSANDQCIALGYARACKATAGRCKFLQCYMTSSSGIPFPGAHSAPAEGTSCGYNKICLNGECVDDPQPNTYIWDSVKKQSVDPSNLDTNNAICWPDGRPNFLPNPDTGYNYGIRPTSSPRIPPGFYYGSNNQESRPISPPKGGVDLTIYRSGSYFQPSPP